MQPISSEIENFGERGPLANDSHVAGWVEKHIIGIVRGVLESLVKSKRYALPLVTVAVLHPFSGGSLAFAWVEGSRFDPRRMAGPENTFSIPATVQSELQGGSQ